MTVDVTVAIPAIPRRVTSGLLQQACDSVRKQTAQPAGGISCALDVNGEGAARTRQRALDAVKTEWVAFLDDDDLFYPRHLEVLCTLTRERGASYVYSWFDGNNPFPMHRGKQLNPAKPHHTTMTVMVKTELAREVGFTPAVEGASVGREDWLFLLGCIQAGATFAGTGEVTWHYRVHSNNTSGLPEKAREPKPPPITNVPPRGTFRGGETVWSRRRRHQR